MLRGFRVGVCSISLFFLLVAAIKLDTLVIQRAYRRCSKWYVADHEADHKMPMGSDLLSSADRLDKILQSFLQLRKCKFCGAMISQKDAFCDKCGKSQV